MQVWIASFVILFILSQFWEWLQSLEYSLPVLALGGLILSCVSNYDKRNSIPFWPSPVPQSGGAEAHSRPIQAPSASNLPSDTSSPAVPQIIEPSLDKAEP